MASIVLTPPLVIAAGAIWPPVCASLVALRFYSRRKGQLALSTDDWLTIPALILVIGISAAILRGVAEKAVAFPTPQTSLQVQIEGTNPQQTAVRKIFFSVTAMQVFALGCIKLSCLFFYRRVFRTGYRLGFELASWTCIILVILWTLAFFFAEVFVCGTHLEYAWTSIANEKKCGTTLALQRGYAVTDVITDLVVLLFPMPILWGLQLSRTRKIALTFLFFLGTAAIMASITRMVIYIQVLMVELSPTPPDEDLLSTTGMYFMILEVGLGLSAICLPATYSLFTKQSLQTMLRGWASALSLSNSSRRRGSRDSHKQQGDITDVPQIYDGNQSEGRSTRTTIGKVSLSDNRDLELGKITKTRPDRIDVIKTFETRQHEVSS